MSPPPQIVQLREILQDVHDRQRTTADERTIVPDLVLALLLVDRLIEQYPELTPFPYGVGPRRVPVPMTDEELRRRGL